MARPKKTEDEVTAEVITIVDVGPTVEPLSEEEEREGIIDNLSALFSTKIFMDRDTYTLALLKTLHKEHLGYEFSTL